MIVFPLLLFLFDFTLHALMHSWQSHTLLVYVFFTVWYRQTTDTQKITFLTLLVFQDFFVTGALTSSLILFLGYYLFVHWLRNMVRVESIVVPAAAFLLFLGLRSIMLGVTVTLSGSISSLIILAFFFLLRFRGFRL